MKLYFMRHGKAAYRSGAELITDAQRPLTDEGRKDVAEVIDKRIASFKDLEVILTSPYLRARQTAELALERLEHHGSGFSGKFLVCDELVPESNPRVVSKVLNQINAGSVLLTTHQPLIGNVLSTLVGDSQLQAIDPAWLVALETGAVLPGFANLCWLQMPGT
ncbi:MAG: histidine phosphatase family protein [Porticoccaceae bacterium]|nr:histidine phosphatase family protein [Porticoccaceae bacterium]